MEESKQAMTPGHVEEDAKLAGRPDLSARIFTLAGRHRLGYPDS
jgi:hypothetical protein